MALSRALERPRFFSSFLTGVGVAALFLALAGVYSVAAIEARVRRREMAIRQALGASYCHLTARVLRHPLLLGAGGAVCGVIAAELLMDTLRVWLFGLRPAGAATCAWAGIGIVLACLLSALGPLIQVLRLQPAVVLRHE
jgi:ABC-type antimicrobial peptide transport system permease subunit